MGGSRNKSGERYGTVAPCRSCSLTKKLYSHEWCTACYNRWWKAGKPEDGPPPLRTRTTKVSGTCLSCGKTRIIHARDWCDSCYVRWIQAGKPDGGPPALVRVPGGIRECSGCGNMAKILAKDLCAGCYYIKRGQSEPADERMGVKKVLWFLENGTDANPFQCVAPKCPGTAHPGHYHLCDLHYGRWRKYGRYEGKLCVRCGAEHRGKAYLCHECRSQGWRRCGRSDHDGDRILPEDEMSGDWICRNCQRGFGKKRSQAT